MRTQNPRVVAHAPYVEYGTMTSQIVRKLHAGFLVSFEYMNTLRHAFVACDCSLDEESCDEPGTSWHGGKSCRMVCIEEHLT